MSSSEVEWVASDSELDDDCTLWGADSVETEVECRGVNMALFYQDAYEIILARGGTADRVASNRFILSVPVPAKLRAMMVPEISSKSGDTGDLAFVLKFQMDREDHPPKIALQPSWKSDLGQVEQVSLALKGGCMEDFTPLCYMKLLMMSIENDVDIIHTLRAFGEAKARERVTERISEASEQFEGVFSLKEDQDKRDLVNHILVSASCITSTRNPVLQVFDVIQYNLNRWGERCYLCGVEHKPPNNSGVPLSCCNDLCRFRVCEEMYGQLYSAVQKRASALGLTFMLAFHAIRSERAPKIFHPLPPDMPIAIVREVFGQIPTMQELVECDCEEEIKSLLHSKHPLMYRLLWWLVSNIPTHITQVDFSEIESIIKSLGDSTVVQQEGMDVFKISGVSTSLHREFEALKSFNRTDWLYHGSILENWYSILKHGPRVMSGMTGLQLNGAAHGKGIYLARNYMTSHGYSSRYRTVGFTPLIEPGMETAGVMSWLMYETVVGLCQSVNVGRTINGTITVATLPEHVNVRYLLAKRKPIQQKPGLEK